MTEAEIKTAERLRCSRRLRAEADEYEAQAKRLMGEGCCDVPKISTLLDSAIALNIAAAKIAGWQE
jgi:hypothetical protein